MLLTAAAADGFSLMIWPTFGGAPNEERAIIVRISIDVVVGLVGAVLNGALMQCPMDTAIESSGIFHDHFSRTF